MPPVRAEDIQGPAMQELPNQTFAEGLARLYRAFWAHARGDRHLVILFMSMQVGAQLIRLAIPYFFAQAVNALQISGAEGLRAAGGYLALAFGAAVAAWMAHGPSRIVERFVALRIRGRFTNAAYARLTALSMEWHARHHSGDTIQRLSKAATALFGFSQNQFVYLQNLVNLVGPLVALCLVSTMTGAAAMAGYLLIALVLLRFDRTIIALARAENRAEGRLLAILVDCLGNIGTVLTLRLQEPTRRLVEERLADIFGPMRRSIVVNEVKWCAIDLLNNATRCGLVALYGWLAYRAGGPVLLGTAVLVHQYAQQAGNVIGTMATQYQDLVRFQTDYAGAGDILAARAEAPGLPPPPDWREIHVEGLGFAHDGAAPGGPGRLGAAKLTLHRGRSVALVGESGSGKSTLMRVLAGLYPAREGRYVVDGAVCPGLRHLGADATLIPQEPEIFEGSLRHNITLGLSYTEAEIGEAIALAELGPMIARLPDGLDTHVEERGASLSGGQRQRLALARGVLAARSSSLILLDEPTSSLDPATEARVYDRLLAAFPQACIVSSIHRLHLLDRFDMVVLMADGGVVDQGELSVLLHRQAGFRALWEARLGTTRLAAE